MIANRRSSLCLVPLVATVLASPAAQGDEAPSEWGLVALEFLGGSAAGFTTVAATYVAASSLDLHPSTVDGAVVAAVVVAPAVQGLVVCAIGKFSKHYGGRCSWPIVGAYLGLLPFVPIALLVSANQPDAIGGGFAAASLLGLGIVLAAPAGATILWNLQKDPLATSSALLPALHLPSDPALRRQNGHGLRSSTTFPLMAGRF